MLWEIPNNVGSRIRARSSRRISNEYFVRIAWTVRTSDEFVCQLVNHLTQLILLFKKFLPLLGTSNRDVNSLCVIYFPQNMVCELTVGILSLPKGQGVFTRPVHSERCNRSSINETIILGLSMHTGEWQAIRESNPSTEGNVKPIDKWKWLWKNALWKMYAALLPYRCVATGASVLGENSEL